jgi:hypothetical protein
MCFDSTVKTLEQCKKICEPLQYHEHVTEIDVAIVEEHHNGCSTPSWIAVDNNFNAYLIYLEISGIFVYNMKSKTNDVFITGNYEFLQIDRKRNILWTVQSEIYSICGFDIESKVLVYKIGKDASIESDSQDGDFENARFNDIAYICVQDNGNLLMSDCHRIKQINLQTQQVETIYCIAESKSFYSMLVIENRLFVSFFDANEDHILELNLENLHSKMIIRRKKGLYYTIIKDPLVKNSIIVLHSDGLHRVNIQDSNPQEKKMNNWGRFIKFEAGQVIDDLTTDDNRNVFLMIEGKLKM